MRLKFTLKLSGLQLPKAFLLAGLFLCFSFLRECTDNNYHHVYQQQQLSVW
jgi:hypothetical protein